MLCPLDVRISLGDNFDFWLNYPCGFIYATNVCARNIVGVWKGFWIFFGSKMLPKQYTECFSFPELKSCSFLHTYTFTHQTHRCIQITFNLAGTKPSKNALCMLCLLFIPARMSKLFPTLAGAFEPRNPEELAALTPESELARSALNACTHFTASQIALIALGTGHSVMG